MASPKTPVDIRREREEALRLQEAVRGLARGRRPGTGRIDAPGLALYFEITGSETLMRVTLVDEITVGRGDQHAHQVPELDLSRHAGYQLGVSRIHACIRLRDQHLEILDLGSKNGTKVNGIPVDTETPTRLKHGDEVMFGRMTLRLIVND